jgi:glucose/arabinose dehydrogenase
VHAPRRLRALALVTVSALAVLGASVGADAASGVTRDARAGTRPAVALEPVSDVEGATAMTTRAGDPALYVALQRGLVVALRPNHHPETVLDLTGLTRTGGEQGFLGLVFSPDGKHLSVHYSGRATGETVVEEYGFADGAIDPTTRRVLLTVPQPQANHNGGQLAFGPDGYLYLGLGDGGNRDDTGPGHVPGGNAQSLQTLLGKVIRIDPRPSGGLAYTVPADNPFAGGGRSEIYVYGLRNPWRFSFDRKTGDLWIADVGQDQYEEVTRLAPGDAAGANLGWNRFEATHPYRDGPTSDVVMPQIETSHDDGNCSITGGYVYRGRKIPALRGWYLYSDYCNSTILAAKIDAAGKVRTRELGLDLSQVSSFGEDRSGELYVLSQDRGVFRIVGA